MRKWIGEEKFPAARDLYGMTIGAKIAEWVEGKVV
jgi:hypothetical protein